MTNSAPIHMIDGDSLTVEIPGAEPFAVRVTGDRVNQSVEVYPPTTRSYRFYLIDSLQHQQLEDYRRLRRIMSKGWWTRMQKRLREPES